MAKPSTKSALEKVSATRVVVKGKLVKLRARLLSSGGESFYLDYKYNGKRKYDFLGLHLIANPKTSQERTANKDSQLLAERIRSERELQLSKNTQIVKASVQRKANFLLYLDEYTDAYPKKDARVIKAMAAKFKKFVGEPEMLPFSDVTVGLCQRFRMHLDQTCSGSTPYNYFKKFRKVLKQAMKDGIIGQNPAEDVENRYVEGIEKAVLTTQEIQKMASVDCYLPEVKRAFLFSCVTGLRFCDVNELEWKSISGNVMRVKQQKTSKDVVVNLNTTAMKLLGERPKLAAKATGKKASKDTVKETSPVNQKIFNLPSSNTCGKHLQNWADKAEIHKKVTWHCARHSFGTNLLITGADVRSVSGLLGHSSLVETQKYVRLVESLKEKAVDNLPVIVF
ncbi:site-specific integrase [Pontibacter sp. BT310]|uniref:Site-specific integrase n=1 Tax=Pontibacter populi TaxID=890055 RepID=A0ABS6XEZ8_9BACT|nr:MULTISPECIES: site-specific integrase [Pontibacter]MBJ6119629.1 site-specific integrase [Pontibacter sp. BT310]MBR0572056.1 site-specific integrase [Microvirga sp. STS03]MBW3366482.1 site-specific integrase [Pontibacter populi]